MSTPGNTAIETYSGLYLDYLDPKPEQIELADIARGLSQACRFAGQTTRFYSVAEHAVYVRDLVVAIDRADLALAALHHDSHEAYLGDWTTPLKNAIGKHTFDRICLRLDVVIAKRFGLRVEGFKHRAVKDADRRALRREAATLKFSHGTGPHWGEETSDRPLAGIGWTPDEAERRFLQAHEEEMNR
jgi:5'-deoxynucleotidase YfbR-like HD superfamily hydrolase